MMTWKSTSEALDLHGSWNGRPRSMHQALRPTGDTSDAALCTVTPSSKPVVTRARARARRAVSYVLVSAACGSLGPCAE